MRTSQSGFGRKRALRFAASSLWISPHCANSIGAAAVPGQVRSPVEMERPFSIGEGQGFAEGAPGLGFCAPAVTFRAPDFTDGTPILTGGTPPFNAGTPRLIAAAPAFIPGVPTSTHGVPSLTTGAPNFTFHAPFFIPGAGNLAEMSEFRQNQPINPETV